MNRLFKGMSWLALASAVAACIPEEGLSEKDSDGDGLSDEKELTVYFTHPGRADTDGDGYSDYEELINKGFAESNNNYRWNPLIADIPELNVNYGTPSFSISGSTTTGESINVSHGLEESISESTTQSQGGSSSHARAAEVYGEFTTKLSSKVSMTPEVTVEVSGTVGRKTTNTNTKSNNWSEAESSTQTENYSEIRGYTQDSSNVIDGGTMRLFVQAENTGHVAYQLSDLNINAAIADSRYASFGKPIGTFKRIASSQIEMPISGVQNEIYELDVEVDDLNELMAHYPQLILTPVIGAQTLGVDNTETNWSLISDDIAALTARIEIDYGYFGREPESYNVATVSNGDTNGLTVAALLENVLKIPFNLEQYGDENLFTRLASLREYNNNFDVNQYWAVAHQYAVDNGVNTRINIYTPMTENQDFANLEVHAGDTLFLTLITDEDKDALDDSMEILLGTNPELADSDEDGLADGEEVYGWLSENGAIAYTSDPKNADSDGDGLSDAHEQTFNTDPGDRDTDNDGASDGYEVAETRTSPTTSNTGYTADDDGDYLTNLDETYIFGTDPNNKDSDGDGLLDYQELGFISEASSMAEAYLSEFGSDKIDTCVSLYNDRLAQLNDSLGFDLYIERLIDKNSDLVCDPNNPDTDDDGLSDGREVKVGWVPAYPVTDAPTIVSNPFHPDSDDDGLTDLEEYNFSSNPLNADTDGDKAPDYAEVNSAVERSLVVPEVAVTASVVRLQGDSCFGHLGGILGFVSSGDQNGQTLLDIGAAFNGKFMTRWAKWNNYYTKFEDGGDLTGFGTNLLWRMDIERGRTDGKFDIRADVSLLDWKGVEFVNDNIHKGAAGNPVEYNSDFFRITDDNNATNMERDVMGRLQKLRGGNIYRPKTYIIGKDEYLEAWSYHLCKSYTASPYGYASFQDGQFLARNDNANDINSCAEDPNKHPLYPLEMTWSYDELLAGDLETTESVTVNSNRDDQCELTFSYQLDISDVQ